MTLRSRLALAMMVAAVLPTAVVVGVPLLRAEARAREEAQQRLDLVRRLAAFLIDESGGDAAARVARAAEELARDRTALGFVLRGPGDAARPVARTLAERHGLDHLEILDEQRVVLSTSRADVATGSRSLLDPPGAAVVVALLPMDAAARAAFVVSRPIDGAPEPIHIVAGSFVSGELIASIARITGQPAALLDAAGREVESLGDTSSPVVTDHVALSDTGWSVRVGAPAMDVKGARRDLLGSFTRIAPLALVSALVVGVLLADRVARPIRALARRADDIAAQHSGFHLHVHDEDEVRSLTRSFDEMLESLSASERQRLAAERIAAWQEVARRIAHEVKNPLSPMKLAVENLLRTREKAPADLDRALVLETTTILEEVESLRRLVDEFSEFARLPGPQPVPVDPRAIAEQALALFAPRIESLAVQVELVTAGAPDSILADREQVGRVLKNVLANALDALEPMAERRLTLVLRRDGQRPGRFVSIEVRDSGVGFEPETLKRVFEPYFTTRSEQGGTGLGMAIAYRIVSEHGGTIEATANRPAPGATITIRLPLGGPLAARS